MCVCFGTPYKNWHNFFCPRWFLVPFFPGYSLKNSASSGTKHVFLRILSMLAPNSTSMIHFPCNCTTSPFADPNHGHIVAVDIRIVQNNKLTKLL